MSLAVFECPNCGAHEMETAPDERLICQFCGSSFGEATRICPTCGHYNEEDVRHCSECGSQVVRDCPACGADNWVLADHCVQCGRNMDLIEQIARRWQQTAEQRLHERRVAMVSLREREERASQGRMADFMEIEQRRQEALAVAQEAQRRSERQLYMIAGVTIAVFVIVMVLVVVLTSAAR
jgi:uncharacterized membrane protein YvbJ